MDLNEKIYGKLLSSPCMRMDVLNRKYRDQALIYSYYLASQVVFRKDKSGNKNTENINFSL